ncbi:hypothetical protein X548_06690 [Stenotrophomonas maltophilia 5BA-I-2]|nr:hypothetical protein X548_06690 [Stenotrophomonas maltophilia 5BA-I-2]
MTQARRILTVPLRQSMSDQHRPIISEVHRPVAKLNWQ